MKTIQVASHDAEPIRRLSEHPHAPKKLYVVGSLDAMKDNKIVTIVGSRIYHPDSEKILEKIIRGLSHYPVVIVSGLALGIDALAHKYALKYDLKTITFPGSGLSEHALYPARHVPLSREIVSSGGALISEFAPEVSGARWTFPLRNRLMAQCADLVLVVEARGSSGTLITAHHAMEAGVSVGALPQSPLVESARGSNKLLQDGAYPILDHTDILRLLNLDIKQEKVVLDTMDESSKLILSLLTHPIQKHQLHELSGLPFKDFIQAVSDLEIKGYISERMGVVTRM